MLPANSELGASRGASRSPNSFYLAGSYAPGVQIQAAELRVGPT